MRWLSILLAVFLALVFATPVFAIADPDSPPEINAVYVYELDDGGVGVLVDYYLDYDFTAPITGTPIPDEPVTDAFLVVFTDTDGTTQLKSVSPYTFENNGYGRGLAWIPFTATEVATYGLDSANVALYKIWLVGNPTVTSGWTGTPPKTIAGIDQWNTTGDPAVLIALRLLYYADILELAWSLDLIETTSIGSRFTSTGESYFENVIPNLRSLAPACFAAGTVQPALEDIDYTTSFGAEARGTIIALSPVTLAEGTNTVTATGTGTFVIELTQGTVGTISNDTGTLAGFPPALDLVAGINTLTVTGAGTFTVVVNLQDTTTALEDTAIGTALDLTLLATQFGMSRWMFSGIIWMIISVFICAAVFKSAPEYVGISGGKSLWVVFVLCIIGGTLLGLLKPIVGIMMFIVVLGFFVGYIIFFRGANA